MKKILMPLAALALLLVLAVPAGVQAAASRAIVTNMFPDGNTFRVLGAYLDGTTRVSDIDVSVPYSGITSTADMISAVNSVVNSSAPATLTDGIVWQNLSPAETQSMIDASFASTTNQADWTQATSAHPGFIKNKPSLSAVATSGAYSDLSGKPSIGAAYEGTTLRTGAFPIFKSATVSSGTAVFHLTADGTSGGTALCTNGVIQDSVNPFVSDAVASYQMSAAWSNSDKTLTVTTNKLTTANILTGILGQSQANGSVVKLSVWCY